MRSVTEPPAAANEILRAVRKGDLAALMSGLEQAEQMACYDPQTPSYTAEQLELLGAVATRMRCSLGRFRRRVASHLEGVDLDLRLLHHLARTPAGPEAPSLPPM